MIKYTEAQYQSILKKASVKIEQLLQEVQALKHKEPIAVVGMACRLPGGANSPEEFWNILKNGVNTIGEAPPERWDLQRYYDPDPEAVGKMYTKMGGFIDRPIDTFDALFFQIAPKEAQSLDPQQRLLLEVAWEALENAGMDTARLKGSRTGVYVGMTAKEYATHTYYSGNPDIIDAYSITGGTFSTAAGRLAYFLDLEGPCMTLDTACSSTLLALHLACQSLQAKESDAALVGGVHLMLLPEVHVCFCKLKALAPDGCCKTFDAAADGYARGEGCAVLVLKRLTDARRDGDTVLAVIKGSATNQDGKSNGLTAPSGRAQEQVIQEAVTNAGMSFAEIDYIEAHGTGTMLGDPIELNALGAIYGPHRSMADPLTIGSVKANIGHLEPVSGLASIIKVILALQHDTIPQQIHFNTPNPYVDWSALPFRIPTQALDWPRQARSRSAGVSAFGFSGTNVHVIVQECPAPVELFDAPPTRQPASPPAFHPSATPAAQLLTLSARCPEALEALAARVADYLVETEPKTRSETEPKTRSETESKTGAPHLADICYTAAVGRTHFEHRTAVVGNSRSAIRQQLLQGPRQMKSTRPPQVVFLFTGQGSQYPGMGRDLYQHEPVFRAALDRCNSILKSYMDIPLIELLYGDQSSGALLRQTHHTQPAIFSLEYALCQLWRSWGITPAVVLGHSIGEYVAAQVAGIFTLEDALKLVAARGRLLQSLPGGGIMAAVFASEARVAPLVHAHSSQVALAAVNAPASVVISGAEASIETLLAQLARENIHCQRLEVSHAFHSPLIEPILAEFRQVAAGIRYNRPQRPIISNITGRAFGADVDGAARMDTPDYWTRHIRDCVRFYDSLQTLMAEGRSLFLEVGATAILTGLGRLADDAHTCTWLHSLKRGADARHSLLEALAQMYIQGAQPDWRAFYATAPANLTAVNQVETNRADRALRKVILPNYPWQRRRFWIEKQTPAAPRQPSDSPVQPEVLTTEAQQAAPNWFYQTVWQPQVRQGWQMPPDYIAAPAEPNNSDGLSSRQVEIVGLLPRIPPLALQPLSVLILTDQQGLGSALAMLLGARGHICFLAVAGERYEHSGKREFYLHPEKPEHFQQLLADLQKDAPAPKIVIHLWSVDAAPTDEKMTGHDLQRSLDISCLAALQLTQAVLKAQFSVFPAFWFVTQDAMPVGTDTNLSGAVQATLWGLGRSIALEHPELHVRHLDLDSSLSCDQNAAMLLAEIQADAPEDEIAIRGPSRYVARLLPASTPGSREPIFHPADTATDPFIGQRLISRAHPDQVVFQSRFTATQPAFLTEHVILGEVMSPAAAHVSMLLAVGRSLRETPRCRLLDVQFTAPLILTESPRNVRVWLQQTQTDTLTGQILSQPVGPNAAGAADPYAQDGGKDWITHCTGTLQGLSKSPTSDTVAPVSEHAADRVADFKIIDTAATYHQLSRLGYHLGEAFQCIESCRVRSGEAISRLRITPRQGEMPPETIHPGLMDSIFQTILFASEAIFEDMLTRGRILIPFGFARLNLYKPITGDFLEIHSRSSLRQDLLEGELRVMDARGDMVMDIQGLTGRLVTSRVLLSDNRKVQDARAEVQGSSPLGLGASTLNLSGTANGKKEISNLPTFQPSNPRKIELRPDAAYLITGGLGGIGLKIAEWMAAHRVGHLILVGRQKPSPETQTTLREIEAGGVSVTVAQADIADAGQVADLFAGLPTSTPPLRGIIHCAGVLDDSVMLQMTAEQLQKVLAPKVHGAWNLHTHTRKQALDFFVMFSSVVSILGSPAQANYGAANAFLDALAHWRQSAGLPALSINWGIWRQIGAAARVGADVRLKQRGIGAMSPQQGLQALTQLLDMPEPQIGVMPMDWLRFLEQSPPRPFFEAFRTHTESTEEVKVELLEKLEELPRRERQQSFTAHIRFQVAAVLGMQPSELPDLQQGFFDIGMDSLTSLELRNRLQRDLACSLPVTLVFDYPTVEALANHLMQSVPSLQTLLAPDSAASIPKIASQPRSAWDRLDELSAEELDALIEE